MEKEINHHLADKHVRSLSDSQLETTDLKPAGLVSILHYIAPSLRVIALTGRSTREDAAVVEKGVFYYTAKPVGRDLVELVTGGKGGI